MKKYFFGVLAMTVALATAAFTNRNEAPLIYFSFTGDTSDPNDVENENLWVEAPMDANCDGTDKACQIQIDEDFVSGVAGSRTLGIHTNLQLQAVEGNDPDQYYPQKISGSDILVLNRP